MTLSAPLAKINWSIKGYHHFKCRPHVAIPLLVKPEPDNVFDPYAMMVCVNAKD